MNRQEFEQFTGRIRSRLVLMASRFVKDSGIGGDADDIVQESLLVLWRQTENGYEMQNPEALAVAITKKMCLAHLRGYNPVVQSIDGFDVVGGVSASAAAIVVLLVCLHIGKPALPEETTCTISTAQILEGMEMLSKIQVGEIGSIVAEPQGDQVIITVKLTNGKERSYSMTGDVYGSSLSFTALN